VSVASLPWTLKPFLGPFVDRASFGRRPIVVGCEPQTVMRGDEEDVVAAISEPVRAALDEGVALVESLLRDLTSHEQEGSS